MYYYNVLAGSQYFHGDKPLTYEYDGSLVTGTIVQIPLRNNEVAGIVSGKVDKPHFKTKSLSKILLDKPINGNSIELLNWISEYYPSPVGALVTMFAPSFLLSIPKTISKKTNPKEVKLPRTKLPPLAPHQSSAIKKIETSPKGSSILLHGVTGSGKTRIYIELARKSIEQRKSSIILTPEIGLTSQLVNEFSGVFGDRVIVTHSNLTPAQRRNIWLRVLRSPSPFIIIGPRSTLFLPLTNIGLIVVDEAHEQAYKQDQSPKYNALRVAAKLAKLNNALLIYGTATPNIADYYNMQAKSLPIISMDKLASGVSKKTTKPKIISIRDRDHFNKSRHLSDELVQAISSSLNKSEQSLIFLNRRGTARIVACNNCGWQATCPNCDLPLTYHGDKHLMMCHTCGFAQSAISACPTCKSTDILFKSVGTKAIVDDLTALFPKANISRFDTDNIKSASLEQNFDDVISGKVDILVGTQILGKGLDLPKLSTVGVISADTSLSFPDFASEERTFQMLTQIIGRVGRGHRKGLAIVQTLNPNNETILCALNSDWDTYYQAQIKERSKYGFPPFYHLLKLSYSTKSADTAKKAASDLADSLGGPIEIVGPAPSFFEKRAGLYTWQITVKAKNRKILLDVIKKLPNNWRHDIDPTDLL